MLAAEAIVRRFKEDEYLDIWLSTLRSCRWVSGLCLLMILAGCASSRVSVLPGSHELLEGSSENLHVLAVGDEATILMIDGTEVNGRVVELSPNSVTLGRDTNFGYDEKRIDSQSIENITWVNAGSIWPYMAAVGVGAVLWSANQISQID